MFLIGVRSLEGDVLANYDYVLVFKLVLDLIHGILDPVVSIFSGTDVFGIGSYRLYMGYVGDLTSF